MRFRRFVPHAACLAMGLLMGFGSNLVRPHGQGEGSAETHSSKGRGPQYAPPALDCPQNALNNTVLLTSIRTAIREEVRAELATHLPQVDAPHAEGHLPIEVFDAKREERQRRTYDKASQALSKAIGYGTWTQEDRQQLRSTLHDLSVPQQDQLIGELFGAIQSGRLRVQDSEPPL